MSVKDSRPSEGAPTQETGGAVPKQPRRKQRWIPFDLRYIGTLDEIAMPGILKTGSNADGGGSFKTGFG